jgi:hypothetical protein
LSPLLSSSRSLIYWRGTRIDLADRQPSCRNTRMRSAKYAIVARLYLSILLGVLLLISSNCKREISSAETVCQQIKGAFTPPNFCRMPDSEFDKVDGVPALPGGWMCSNPPYDKEVGYGSCTDPKTKKFDFHYCLITGIPREGCTLVPRPSPKA